MVEINQEFLPLEQKEPSILQTQLHRTWCQRTFGKMQSGSVRGSIFTLTATALGAGFFAIPQVLQWSGLILGLLIISFSGLLIYFSLYVVSRCCFRQNVFHYATVTERILGRFWGVLLEIAIIANAVGLIITLNIIVGSLIPSILDSINIDFGRTTQRDLIMVILNLVIVVPLGLMRKLGALRFKALFNLISLSYTLLIVIIEFPFFVPHNNYKDMKYFNIDINIFNAFASGLFAFLCQQNLTRVQSELINKNQRRMTKVNIRSIALMDFLLSAISLFGYLSLLNDIPDIIIERKAPSGISNDWAMVLAKVLVSISMTISIPINLSPCRYSIEKLVFKIQEKSPFWLHVTITLSIIGFTLIVAIFFPDITFMISFLGGFCGSVMALIIPSLLYVNLSGNPATTPKNLAILIGAGFLSLIAFISIIINLIDQF